MNTLFAIWRSLRRSRSPLRRIALSIDACLHVNLILWTLRRKRRWRRRCSDIFCWAFLRLRPLDVNHFAIAMIESDWVVAFVGVRTRVGAQGWSRDIPRLFVFHLEIIGKHRVLIIDSLMMWRQKKLMKFHPRHCFFLTLDHQGEPVVGDTFEHDLMEK